MLTSSIMIAPSPSTRDQAEARPLTVSQLAEQLRSMLQARFPSVWVEGEISNFRSSSGIWFFTLKDNQAQVFAVCFQGVNSRIRFSPANGQLVRARGYVSFYRDQAKLQLYVGSLALAGDGSLQLAFEQLRDRLKAEGLFAPELKRPLPLFPRRVGIVTSPTGAAIRDILNVVSRRTHTVHLLLSPTRVQGQGAGREIARAIRLINNYHQLAISESREKEMVDVLIVGRGGGSLEDLWPFNEEEVARAIRASLIPVISAVGHETDFTIADFAADRRAETPSAAAELVAEQEDKLCDQITQLAQSLDRATRFNVMAAGKRIEQTGIAQTLERVRTRVGDAMMATDRVGNQVDTAVARILRIKKQQIDETAKELAQADPRLQLAKRQLNLSHLSGDLDDAAASRLRSGRALVDELSRQLTGVAPGVLLSQSRLRLNELSFQVEAGAASRIRQAQSALRDVREKLSEHAPHTRAVRLRFTLDNLAVSLKEAALSTLTTLRHNLSLAGTSLDALSPFEVLNRGYALVEDERGILLRDARLVSVGDSVHVKLAQGRLDCRVEGSDET